MNNVISTTISFYRNLKDYKFVPKLTETAKKEIKAKVTKVLGEENLTFFNTEHLCLKETFDGFDDEGFALAKDKIDKLSNSISLSFNDDYGFLMSDLNKLGAGLQIECDLDLVGLKQYNKIEQVKQNVKHLGYVLKEKNGNVFTLTTTCNLGYTTTEIYDEFKKTCLKLQELEVESEKMLDTANHDFVTDKVLRSFAILKSAYILNFDELNELISTLRVGENLGIVDLPANAISKLQNLTKQNKEFVSQTELKDLAKNVQKVLKGE